MAKTPVSVLQEYCARQVIVPQYDLIVNGVGTHNPIFKYRLTVCNVTTYGDGKSKKEAKHEAARQAVTILLPLSKEVKQARPGNLNSTQSGQEDFFSPYQDVIKENSIGELASICANKLLPDPEYVLVGEVGQPHAKTFTFECNVAKLKECASSRTKQQAKHLSAIKMIERLKSVFGPMILEIDTKAHDAQEKKINDLSAQASSTFCKVRGKKISESYSLGLKDYHKLRLRDVFDTSPLLSDLAAYPKIMNKSSVDPCELLKKLAEAGNRMFIFTFLRTHKRIACSCDFDTIPYFVTISLADTEEDAQLKAAHKMLLLLKSFL